MKRILLSALVLAVLGCSENPLDPDNKGEVKTAFDDELAAVDECEAACNNVVRCLNAQDRYNECLGTCAAEWNSQQRAQIAQASCDELIAAAQGGGG